MAGPFLINPDDKTVTAVDFEPGTDFLDFVRLHVGAPQLAVLAVNDGRMAVWCDSMGMIKPGRNFWRFNDSQMRFAGKTILTAINGDGMPSPFPDAFTPEVIASGIAWHPSAELVKIREEIYPGEDSEGRMIPFIIRNIEWNPPIPDEAEEAEPSGWTIFENEDGSYRAIRYAVQDDELRPMEMLKAANLDQMRERLPKGLERIPADDNEDAVEHWAAPLVQQGG